MTTSAHWRINLDELGARPGSSLRIERTITLPEGWGTDVVGFRAGSELELDGSIDRVLDGVYCHLHVSGDAAGECVRCLRPVTVPVRAAINEMFFNQRAIDQMRAEGDDDTEDLYLISDDVIDVEQAARDNLIADFPFQLLCEADCPGLCPHCGIDMRQADADHHHEIIDPRWAKLAELAKVIE
ncbi:MAG: YceD family protein, partial [Bowdeniella nasicola]|nr:YceD family protein [Bowdeniella nasicola]